MRDGGNKCYRITLHSGDIFYLCNQTGSEVLPLSQKKILEMILLVISVLLAALQSGNELEKHLK